MTTDKTEHLDVPPLKVDRCPHCNVANPYMSCVFDDIGKPYKNEFGTPNSPRYSKCLWKVFICSSCDNRILTLQKQIGLLERHMDDLFSRIFIWPKERDDINSIIPEGAKNYLQQARDTINAPDACVIMCASALDVMLQEKDIPDADTLNERILAAVEKGLITQDMASWAKQVRLEANNSRHPKKNKPPAKLEEAQQSLEFVETLAEILFVIPDRVTKGIKNTDKSKAAG